MSEVLNNRCWLDYRFNSAREKTAALYRIYNLPLSLQDRIERKQQASAIFQQGDNYLLICRYLYSEDGINISCDNLLLHLTENKLITLRNGNEMLFTSLQQLLNSLPPDKTSPHQMLNLLLEKIYTSTANIIYTMDNNLTKLFKAATNEDSLPSLQEVATLNCALGAARETANGLRLLLPKLPASSGITSTGNYQSLYFQLTALCADMDLVLNTALWTFTSLTLLCQQNKQNTALLKRLTTLSAVFFPLIFIASLYGMRFEYMHELQSQWGYPVSLLAMAIVAILAWWYNKKS